MKRKLSDYKDKDIVTRETIVGPSSGLQGSSIPEIEARHPVKVKHLYHHGRTNQSITLKAKNVEPLMTVVARVPREYLSEWDRAMTYDKPSKK